MLHSGFFIYTFFNNPPPFTLRLKSSFAFLNALFSLTLVYLQRLLIILSCIFVFTWKSNAQNLQAFAGPDINACPGNTVVLGTSVAASGGLGPYLYTWTPATGLNTATVANPTLTVGSNTVYLLTVRDANDSIAHDTLKINIIDLSIYSAGTDTTYCPGIASNIPLGNPINSTAIGITFNWTPSLGLNNASSPNPIANPTTTTIYSLTVSQGPCSVSAGTVAVNISGINLNLAFKDTIIKEGTTITLLSTSAASSFTWLPKDNFIKYDNSPAPDVNPIITTTYTIIAIDGKGCIASDTVRVIVTPDDELIFYSAFTPNGDGNNDYFYIGNIYKYPNNILKIYNRYGQVIFTSAGYKNDWNGEYQGNKVPTGTYFYVLDSGTEKGKYTGSVTIMR